MSLKTKKNLEESLISRTIAVMAKKNISFYSTRDLLLGPYFLP